MSQTQIFYLPVSSDRSFTYKSFALGEIVDSIATYRKIDVYKNESTAFKEAKEMRERSDDSAVFKIECDENCNSFTISRVPEEPVNPYTTIQSRTLFKFLNIIED